MIAALPQLLENASEKSGAFRYFWQIIYSSYDNLLYRK